MPANSATSTTGVLFGLLAAVVIVAASIVGIVAVVRTDVSGQNGSGLATSFDLELDRLMHVAPELIRFAQVAEFPVGLQEVRAVATDAADNIYVAGDEHLVVFSPVGERLREVALRGKPTCLAVGGSGHVYPGRVYVGLGDHVKTLSPAGDPIATWESLGAQALLTSIACAEDDLFVADAGNRLVRRFHPDGTLAGNIGQPDPERHVRGFVIPSPCFDVAVTHDQLLRVVNPGARRIESYTFDGDPMVHWGQAGPAIDRFFGCCNPANMCLLPDDRFVTVEKGLPRVKVYGIDGTFESVVATPAQMAPTKTIAEETRSEHQMQVFDVAADTQGRVLLLDPHRKSVRVFEEQDVAAEKSGMDEKTSGVFETLVRVAQTFSVRDTVNHESNRRKNRYAFVVRTPGSRRLPKSGPPHVIHHRI